MEANRDPSQQSLSDAVKGNIDSVAAFYEREESKISGTQSAIEKISRWFGSAAYFSGLTAFVALWIAASLLADRIGWPQFDPSPFTLLQGIVGLNGVLITVAVLIRQNRMARAAELRAHLNLQIDLLAEQKVTKLIKLIEELRQDLPGVRARQDPEVDTMQAQVDPHVMLHELESYKIDRPVK